MADGFGIVAEVVGLDAAIAEADLVVTGEGQLDVESFAGKVVGGVASMASQHGVPVWAIVGRITSEAAVLLEGKGITEAVDLSDTYGDADAMQATLACVRLAFAQLL